MYTYNGDGMVISLLDWGGYDKVLAALNTACDTDCADMEEFDDTMALGTYESADNVLSAMVNDRDIDASHGLLILSSGTLEYKEEPVNRLFEQLCPGRDWRDLSDIIGIYMVETLQ